MKGNITHKSNCKCPWCKAEKREFKGKNNPNYGNSWTDEKRKEFSEKRKGEGNPMYGKIRPEHSGRMRGENNPSKRLEVREKLSRILVEKKGIPVDKHKVGCLCASCLGTSGKFKGRDNPNWRNGASFEPYSPEFNNELKKFIRQQDNFQCQFCGNRQLKPKLPIHHIDYNKQNCSLKNLISLCKKCNSLANFQRDKWQFLFETLQEIRNAI